MKKTRYSETKGAAPVLAETSGKLAETCWFVSSFVMSLIMGPFSALPALIAIFSLKIHGPTPMKIC